MSYQKADRILPYELLERVQEYVDGTLTYMPKAVGYKGCQDEGTSIRQELRLRNRQIYSDYLSGKSTGGLSSLYYLSLRSIQRVIGQEKRNR